VIKGQLHTNRLNFDLEAHTVERAGLRTWHRSVPPSKQETSRGHRTSAEIRFHIN
jgi:hypothetical protein